MAKPSVEDVRAQGSASQLHRWNLSFDSPPPALGGNFGGINPEILSIRCQSAEIPTLLISDSEIKLHGHTIRQPSIGEVNSPLTFTFVEFDDRGIAKAIKAWRDIIYDQRTGKSLPIDQLTATVRLELLDVEDNPTWEYTLHGAYLQTSDPGGVPDAESFDPLKPTMVLSYTWFEENSLV